MKYRYRLLAPHASCDDVSQWLIAHAKNRNGLAVRICKGEMLPIAMFDSDEDAQAFRESYDSIELDN